MRAAVVGLLLCLVGCGTMNELCVERCVAELSVAEVQASASKSLTQLSPEESRAVERAASKVRATLDDLILERCEQVCRVAVDAGAEACLVLCEVLGIGGCEEYCGGELARQE